MLIKKLSDVDASEQRVEAPNGNWVSRRLLLKEDGMGFSVHDTIIREGTETYIWYKHHLEAVYCIEGCGEIEDLETGITHPIEAGTLYALDRHERHNLRAFKEMRMVCVFNPPLRGSEVHTEEGFYPIDQDE